MRSQSFCKLSFFPPSVRTASRCTVALCTIAICTSSCSSDTDASPAPLTPAPPDVPVALPPQPSATSVTPEVQPAQTPGPTDVAPAGSVDATDGQPPTDTTEPAGSQGNVEPQPDETTASVNPDPVDSSIDTTDAVAPTIDPDTTADTPAVEPDTDTDDSACSEMPAPNERITAFDNWDLETLTWGEEPDLTGGYFTYAGDGSLLEPFLSEDEPELRLIGNVQNYFGIGLWFGPCLDASEYLGISFTITGELGDPAAVEEDPLLNGEVELQLQTSKNYVIDTDNAKGECEGSWSDGTCKSNVAIVPVDDAEPLVELLWEDFTGGAPETTVSPNQLLGLQWQFNCQEVEDGPGCDMDITIDNVQFILP